MPEGDAVTLRILGVAGAQVDGVCHLMGKGGVTTVRISGAVPLHRRWPATGVRCELRANGQVTVEITGRHSSSRTSTSGGLLVVEVH